jgi:hypothetical protein
VSINPGDMRPKFDLLTELEANAGAHTVTAENPGRPIGTRAFPRELHSYAFSTIRRNASTSRDVGRGPTTSAVIGLALTQLNEDRAVRILRAARTKFEKAHFPTHWAHSAVQMVLDKPLSIMTMGSPIRLSVVIPAHRKEALEQMSDDLGVEDGKLITFCFVIVLAQQPEVPHDYRRILTRYVTAFAEELTSKAELSRVVMNHYVGPKSTGPRRGRR